MISNRLDELFEAWSEGRLAPEEASELSAMLRISLQSRKQFREAASMHGLLHVAAASMAVNRASAPPYLFESSFHTNLLPPILIRQAVFAILVGMLAGGLGVTAVWAYSSSVLAATSLAAASLAATSQTVEALVDGDFEREPQTIGNGFPVELGKWSGDEAAIVKRSDANSSDNLQALRFIAAGPDAATIGGRAIACDQFQLIDLQSLRNHGNELQDAVLELSADFLDSRPQGTNPSVTFYCQLYLFRGDALRAHENWPAMISESISSGSAQATTLGKSDWKTVTARCFTNEDADFAVVHVSAMPNLRVPMPENLFVDNVRIVLKTQPKLPVRVVHKPIANESRKNKTMNRSVTTEPKASE